MLDIVLDAVLDAARTPLEERRELQVSCTWLLSELLASRMQLLRELQVAAQRELQASRKWLLSRLSVSCRWLLSELRRLRSELQMS